MNTMSAWAMGAANREEELKVFDWDRAAKLIREHKPESAGAGLGGDWEWTGGTIFKNGRALNKEETYTYLASTWATPELEMDGERVDCYKMQSETPGWNSETFWPQSALDILNQAE